MIPRIVLRSTGYVEDKAGDRAGLCVLIAPDLIATCTHVVAEALEIDRSSKQKPDQPVRVCFPSVGEGHSLGTVEHWAPFDTRLSPGSDLALLRLATPPPSLVPQVELAPGDALLSGREITALTYDAPLPGGESRLGRIVDDYPFLSVHGSGFGAKGMSGGGLWTKEAHPTFVGLFSGVPTGYAQTSGYAIPASEVADALSELGEQAVLGRGLFEPFPRVLQESFGPAALLDARYGIAPFISDPEIEQELDEWVERDDALLVRLEYGPGGVGKTRRWLEYCHKRAAQGLFGVLSRREDPVPTLEHLQWLSEAHETRVIVIDYAESQAELLAGLLTFALEARTGRTRIILLARNAADWWARLQRRDEQLQTFFSSNAIIEARAAKMPIPPNRLGEALSAATAAYTERLGHLNENVSCDETAVDLTRIQSTLEIQMAALAAATGEAMDDLVAMVLNRERRFWDHQAKPHLPAALIEAMAAAVYQVDGIATRKDAEAMFRGRGAFRDLKAHELAELFTLMRSLYPGEKFLNPLQPDLIGERLLEELDVV